MENLYLGKNRYAWIQEFGQRMNKLTFGSVEYEKCRKIYAWLCERERVIDKVRTEEIIK